MTATLKIADVGADAVLSLEPDGADIQATIRRAGNVVVSAAVPKFELPEWCIEGDPAAGRLSPEKAKKHLEGLAQAAAARARSELLDTLRRLETIRIDFDGDFFGAHVEGGGELKLFLSRWLLDADAFVKDDRLAEFTVRVDAAMASPIAGLRATHATTVVVRASGARLRLSVEDLNFAFPEIDFDTLDLRDFTAPLDGGKPAASLLEKLAGLAKDASLECTDPPVDQPPRLRLKVDGGKLLWAFVKQGVSKPSFQDPAALANELASFRATFGWDGFKAEIEDIKVAAIGDEVIAQAQLKASGPLVTKAAPAGRLGPVAYRFENLSVTLKALVTTKDRAITALVSFQRLVVWLVDDPETVIALAGEVELTPSATRIVRLDLVEPYPIKLVRAAADALARGARAVANLLAGTQGLDASQLRHLLEILGKFAAAVARQASVVGSAVANAVSDAASVVADMLDTLAEGIAQLLRKLQSFGPSADDLDIQVTIGLDPVEVLQVLVVRRAPVTKAIHETAAGFELTLHEGWRLGVLVDLGAQRGAYLIATPQAGTKTKELLTLGTDLWLQSTDTVERVPDADQTTGNQAKKRIIQVTAKHAKPDGMLLVLAGLRGNKGVFLQEFRRPPKPGGTGALLLADPDSSLVPIVDALGVDVSFDKERLLPLLGMGETGKPPAANEPEGGFLKKLKDSIGQVVWVEKFTHGSVTNRTVKGQLALGVKAAGVSSQVSLDLELFLDPMEVKVTGGNEFGLKSRRIEEEALGLTWVVEQKDAKARKDNTEVEMFTMNFSGGESGFALNDKEAQMELRFGGLSGDGSGVVFKVTKFRVGRNGVDISAVVDDKAVRLNGLDVPFRFRSGKFEMRGGRLLEASISGRGSLPPALVGEADCTLALTFTQTASGIELQSGKVEIDKKGEPIVCHSTRFTLTVSDLDVGIQKDGGGWHFYFLVTGSLRFTPKPGEFESGLLAFLKDIEINLERTPLTGDARVLARHISFQKALSPKKTFNVFNLFSFELRGFGFHPASPRFDGQPAINLSGQIKFAEIGDVMQPKIDFHGLWIAPPKKGEALPRISAEGLGVDLQLSGAVKVRGSVLAVDPGTRTVESRELAPPGFDTYGFLGEGEVEIPGWGSMPAALGFLELEKKETGERKKAFFVYLQRDKLAIKIPTGFWTFYMREVGFGFGFRYTLAAIREADAKPSLPARIKALDDASKRQGDLARFAAWSPEGEGDRFTLALRGALQAYPAKEVYNEKEEETVENPFFFDLVVALRSDFTLLASLRGYLGVNYADFRANKDNFRERPGLRGYLYVSAPRSELLARMIGDSRGHIGERLPNLRKGQIMRQALESVDWSATLYIRPGLFHYELGWPDQLSVRLVDNSNMKVSVRGGMIFRVADDGILWGYNIEADAWLRFGGSVGSDIGVAIEATLQARFVARLIAYLSWRFQGSMVYGLVSLDATLTFSVRAWMRVNLRFTSFTIRIGFSFSVQFSAAIELVIGTDGIGARVQARVAVHAFGCTLGVYVGFAFNDGALDDARARVQRFLAMSITAEQPADPPQIATAKADERADQAAQRVEAAKPQPSMGQDKEPERDKDGHPTLNLDGVGRPIGATRFWMALHADPARPGYAYALLVPREAAIDAEGGFYSAPVEAPHPVPPAHQLHVAADFAGLGDIEFVNRDANGSLKVGNNPRDADWNAAVPVDGGSGAQREQPVALRSLFNECFITSFAWDETTQQPVAGLRQEPFERRETLSGAGASSGTAQERAADRDRLQKDKAAHAARMPADERAYQARSTMLAMFLDQFVTLATRGKPASADAHVLDLGLVLAGPVDALERLASVLTIEKADCVGPAGGVEVLNPSRGWFMRQDPQLAFPRSEMSDTGPRLAWDLETFGAGPAEIDPDNFLLHYEVVRTVETREFTPHLMRVKPAATMGGPAARSAEAGGHGVRIELLKADWQFTDDFADLPEEWRQALLPPRTEAATVEAAAAWIQLALQSDVTITYSVTPVDIAGTRGQPRSFTITVDKPQPALRPAQAELRIFENVSNVESRTEKKSLPGSLEIYMGLRDAAWEKDTSFTVGGHKYEVRRQYRLYVQQETVLPAGSFGSDGLTDRVRGIGGTAAVTAAIDRAVAQQTADSPLTFVAAFRVLSAVAGDAKPGSFTKRIQELEDAETRKRLPLWALLSGDAIGETEAMHAKLPERLWNVDDDSRAACRFWLRTEIEIVREHEEKPTLRLVSTPTEVPSTLVLRPKTEEKAGAVVPTKPRKGELTVLQPQAFEWPVELDFPPLKTGQVRVETGFMHVMAPQPGATLLQWASSGADALTTLRDPARRTLALLEFDAAPAWEDAEVAAVHRSSIAGYDVHELDLDDLALADGALQLDGRAWTRARRIAHVKLLPRETAQLTPAATADWLAWHAQYPSETWRTARTAEDMYRGQALPVRRGWYSPAESRPQFAERLPRLRLLPHAVDVAVDALLANGEPQRVRARLEAEPGTPAAKTVGTTQVSVVAEHLSLTSEDAQPLQQDGEEFLPLDGAVFTATQLRYLLLCLCHAGFDPEVLGMWRADPASLDGLRLVLTAVRPGSAKPDIAAFVTPVSLGGPLHGLLEETVAELAWGVVDPTAKVPSIYRRYAVTVQAPPAVDARELAKFLAATPSGVDPYGWCVLQSLGLSATVRLFDLELAEFADPSVLAREVQRVYSAVARRWRMAAGEAGDHGPRIGQPFAEVLLKPGSNRIVRPFDGAVTATMGPHAFDVADRSLAMIQLSLRPAPVSEWQYLLLQLPPPSQDPAVPQSPDPAVQPELVGPPEGQRRRTREVAVSISRPGEGEAIDFLIAGAQVLAQLPSGASSCTLAVAQGGASRAPLLVARMRGAAQGLKNITLQYVYSVETTTPSTSGSPAETRLETAKAEIQPTHATVVLFPGLEGLAYDPFGSFAEKLPDDWASPATIASLLANLHFVAPGLTGPITEADLKVLMPQYVEWARRFLDHAAGPQAVPADDIALALAAPSRLSPCELAADSAGVLTLAIPSEDKLAHARAYAVRPVSRYAHVVAAAQGPGAQEQVEMLSGTKAWSDIGYAVAVHPRIERVEPPVILGNAVRGERWELVLARHGEESLAHSNRPLFARLGKPSLLISQMRAYRLPSWPGRLRGRFPQLDLPVLHPQHEPAAVKRPGREPAALDGTRIDVLAREHPSLWKGAEVIDLPPLAPHYKGAVLAVARAGIVVSNISAVVQDDFGRAQLQDMMVESEPTLRVERTDSQKAKLVLRHRLASHHDLTPAKARIPAPRNDADVAWWPDPDVVYSVVHTATVAGRRIREELLEIRLVGFEPPREGAAPTSIEPVMLRARSDRWLPGEPTVVQARKDGRSTFEGEWSCTLKPDGPAGDAVGLHVDEAWLGTPEQLRKFATEARNFLRISAERARLYRIAKTDQEDWDAYAERVKTLAQDDVQLAHIEGTELHDELKELLGKLRAWFADPAHGQGTGKALDEAVRKGDFQPYAQVRRLRWPRTIDAGEGLLQVFAPPDAQGADLVLNDIPSDIEAGRLLELKLPLAAKDSPFWQLVVQRVTGGADMLLLRQVDARGPAPGSDEPVSVREIGIRWPDFVESAVTRKAQA